MSLFKTICRLFVGKPGLDRLPFKALVERYENEPVAVFKEFVNRLQPLVLQAVRDLLTRRCQSAADIEVEGKSMDVFEDFTPEFASGAPSMVLVRFADAIRRVLDEEAFDAIATRYYRLLPLYHVKDDHQRRFLSALYERGVGSAPETYIAQRFQVPVDEASRIIRDGNHSLEDVIANDFTEDELSEMTEGKLRRRY